MNDIKPARKEKWILKGLETQIQKYAEGNKNLGRMEDTPVNQKEMSIN